jgi:hypothetical protein
MPALSGVCVGIFRHEFDKGFPNGATGMTKGHKANTATFEELTFAEQAKSITASLANVKKSIAANLQQAKEEGRDGIDALRQKRYEQVACLAESLNPNPH